VQPKVAKIMADEAAKVSGSLPNTTNGVVEKDPLIQASVSQSLPCRLAQDNVPGEVQEAILNLIGVCKE
jgi:hypothetical protein